VGTFSIKRHCSLLLRETSAQSSSTASFGVCLIATENPLVCCFDSSLLGHFGFDVFHHLSRRRLALIAVVVVLKVVALSENASFVVFNDYVVGYGFVVLELHVELCRVEQFKQVFNTARIVVPSSRVVCTVLESNRGVSRAIGRTKGVVDVVSNLLLGALSRVIVVLHVPLARVIIKSNVKCPIIIDVRNYSWSK
jgi:hypothetical protein